MLTRSREPFGSTAVRLGYASTADVVRALQEKSDREARQQEPILTGMLMVELGILSTEQVAAVLENATYREVALPGDALRLAARLTASFADEVKVICVSGSNDADTATVVRHTAVAMALMGRGSVLFVDATAREKGKHTSSPPLGEIFPESTEAGFAELLQGDATPEEAIWPTPVPELLHLGTGQTAPDYVRLLLSARFADQIASLRNRFRFILLEAPPLLETPHAPLIAAKSDAVLLVVSAGKWRKTDVRKAKRLLDGLNVRSVGAVLHRE